MRFLLIFLTIFLLGSGFAEEKLFVRLVVAASEHEVSKEMKGEWIQESPEHRIFLRNDAPTLIFKEFQNVRLSKDQFGNVQVIFHLYPSDAKKFAAMTKENVGRQVACYIGKKFFCAPVVMAEIANGSFCIAGNFDEKDLDLIKKMNDGKKVKAKDKHSKPMGAIGLLKLLFN